MSHKDNLDKRTKDCVDVEMRFNGDSFLGMHEYNSDFNVHITEITCSTDEEWNKIITGLRDSLKIRKENLMKENKFPEFWYESNACWGNVKNMEDLKEKLKLQTDPKYGALKDKDEFLDRSLQNVDESMDFGTRGEHRGGKTLREFLVENDVDFSDL